MTLLFVLAAAAPIMATEKGSGRFSLEKALFAGGTEIKAGSYDVKYEISDQGATVTFAPIGKPKGIQIQGKVESVEKKYEYNSMGIGKDAEGRDAILHIFFRGKAMRIVF